MKTLHILFTLLAYFIAKHQMYPIADDDWSKALPFTKTLEIADPLMEGRDVMILQSLLKRFPKISLTVTGIFDSATEEALKIFQESKNLPATGALNPTTAIMVLKDLMSDEYKDDGFIPDDAMFKLYIPVYQNRSIETIATLYNKMGEVLFRFPVRTRGSTSDKGAELNQLTTNGDTPTGLCTMDLNSPEPKELVKSFGPYPVLRFVKGIKGNSAIGRDNHEAVDGQETFLSNYRTGILVHTGVWDDWEPGKPMPNSNGCVHAYPDHQKRLVDILMNELGVKDNENPFGKLPYPFKPQGIVSVEQID